MPYSFTICHPDKPDIEKGERVLTHLEMLDKIKWYPWLDILKSMESMPDDRIHYSPSIDFTDEETNLSLCITATLENGSPEFSLWYNRLVTRKAFGFFGKPKEKMEVVDKWGFSLDQALEYFHLFVNNDHEQLEHLMTTG